MLIEDVGPRLSVEELERLEAALGLDFPSEYRTFLLDTNGGVPNPDVIDIDGFQGSPVDVQVLFGVGRTEEVTCLEWNHANFAERLGPAKLPIACDSGGNLFCLALGPLDGAAVVYVDLEEVFAEYGAKPVCYCVASSVRDFLEKLRSWE